MMRRSGLHGAWSGPGRLAAAGLPAEAASAAASGAPRPGIGVLVRGSPPRRRPSGAATAMSPPRRRDRRSDGGDDATCPWSGGSLRACARRVAVRRPPRRRYRREPGAASAGSEAAARGRAHRPPPARSDRSGERCGARARGARRTPPPRPWLYSARRTRSRRARPRRRRRGSDPRRCTATMDTGYSCAAARPANDGRLRPASVVKLDAEQRGGAVPAGWSPRRDEGVAAIVGYAVALAMGSSNARHRRRR